MPSCPDATLATDPGTAPPAGTTVAGEGFPDCADVSVLTVATVLAGCHALITPVGDIDVDTAPALELALGDCLDHRPSRVHVDLYGVRFCDCSGLNVLLRARRRAHAAGVTLALHDPSRIVARLFAITETDSVFTTPAET